MASDDDTTRRALLEALMESARADPYPSGTTLDLIESVLSPEEVGPYAEMLLEKVRHENFPSVSMLTRLRDLC